MHFCKKVAMSKDVLRWVYLLVLSLIWGSSYILIKKGLVGLSPIQVGSFRILMTTAILLVVGHRHLYGIRQEQWKWLAFTGFVGTFFPSFLFAYSETEIDSSIAAVLNGLTPVFTLIISGVVFGQPLLRRQAIGVIVGFLGTILLVVQELTLTTNDGRYALLVIVAALCYGINVTTLKHRLQGVSPMGIALGNFIFICIPAALLLATSNFPWANFYTQPKIIHSLGFIFILSAVGTAFAKVLFNRLLAFSSAVFTISITYLIPIVAIFWGVLDGESFGWMQAGASLLILGGIYLVTEQKKAP